MVDKYPTNIIHICGKCGFVHKEWIPKAKEYFYIGNCYCVKCCEKMNVRFEFEGDNGNGQM